MRPASESETRVNPQMFHCIAVRAGRGGPLSDPTEWSRWQFRLMIHGNNGWEYKATATSLLLRKAREASRPWEAVGYVLVKRVRKTAKSDYNLRHICPSIRSHRTTQLPLGWFSLELISEYFSKLCYYQILSYSLGSFFFINIWLYSCLIL